MNDIDTANRFMVGATADARALIVANPPTRCHRLSPDEALNLAAWLVALADPAGEKFPAVLKAVQNT